MEGRKNEFDSPEEGDILFFKLPRQGASFKDKCIVKAQQARKDSNPEFVHVAIVTNTNPLTITHLAVDGVLTDELKNSAYANHEYEVMRANNEVERGIICNEATKNGKNSVAYSKLNALKSFFKPTKSKSNTGLQRSPEKLEAEIAHRTELICSGFVAQVTAKAVTESGISTPDLLPGELWTALKSGPFVALQKSQELESKERYQADNQALSKKLGEWVQYSQTKKFSLAKAISLPKLSESMCGLMLKVNQVTIQANTGRDPVTNLTKAIEFILQDRKAEPADKKVLIEALIKEAHKLKIVNEKDYTKNLTSGELTSESLALSDNDRADLQTFLSSSSRSLKSSGEKVDTELSTIQSNLCEAISNMKKPDQLKEMMKEQVNAAKDKDSLADIIDKLQIPDKDKVVLREKVNEYSSSQHSPRM